MRRMKKPKVIKVKLIERLHEDGTVREPYRIMESMVGKHHPHLASAKIAMAWRFDMKPDPDGHLTLGQARKASDLDRELHSYDFVIVLNADMWNRQEFDETRKTALIDHELCHRERAKDKDGEDKLDAGGHPVWRIRKHDIEEFTEIVGRYGMYKTDIEKFVAAAVAANTNATLFDGKRPTMPDRADDPAGKADAAPTTSGSPHETSLVTRLSELLPDSKTILKLVEVCFEHQPVSISLIQRQLNTGYTTTKTLVTAMVEGALLGPIEGQPGKFRCIMTPQDWDLIKPHA